jgi:hypothetical protein
MTEPTVPVPTATPEPTDVWNPPARPLERPLPGSLLVAGVLLLIGAGLAVLAGGIMFLTGTMFDQIPTSFNTGNLSEEQFRASMDIARGLVLALGIGALLVAVAHLFAGIGVLRRRGWGRILGLVVSALGVLFLGFGLLGTLVAMSQPLPAGYLQTSGLTAEQYRSMIGVTFAFLAAILGIGLAVYVFVLVVLARKGSAFAGRQAYSSSGSQTSP